MKDTNVENETKLAINGSFVANFKDLKLKQSMYEHHSFSVRVDHDSIEKRGSYTIEESRNLLGAPLGIHFGDCDFVGTITNVSLSHQHGHEGDIILSGYSQSIKLEDAPTLNSWNHNNLGSIFEKVLESTGIPAEVRPKSSRPIPYMCQFEESSYAFLKRMAAQYYEWLFWDGVKLVFGRPEYSRPIKLEYGPHLDDVHIAIESRPHKFSVYSYRDVDNELTQNKTTDRIAGVNLLGDYAVGSSQELYRKAGVTHTQRSTIDRDWMDPYLEGKQGAAVADIHLLKAKSTVQGLKLNSIIKIASLRTGNKYEENEPEHYGEYRIIEIAHHAEGNGVYRCSFSAIPSGMEYLPTPDYKQPTAYPHLATVIENEDPLHQGRIKARFPWQDGSQDTDWIQVMTPDAGSSGKHAHNRGQVFIPEVGDQLMIGFRYGDPMRPFAMGSMFHGENSKGGGAKNSVKSITTRSGHVLEFNDASGGEKITIKDKNENHIIIDTKQDTITINAVKNMNLIAGENLHIQAGKDIHISAGGNMQEQIGKHKNTSASGNIIVRAAGDIQEQSDNRTELAEEAYTRQAMDSHEAADEIIIQSQQDDLRLQSGKKVQINGREGTNLF